MKNYFLVCLGYLICYVLALPTRLYCRQLKFKEIEKNILFERKQVQEPFQVFPENKFNQISPFTFD